MVDKVKLEQAIWWTKYRPKTLEDIVLPKSIRQEFEGYVKDNFIPNLVLYGKTGIGKTSTAIAALNAIGADWIIINGNKDGNIDTLRNTVQQHASTMSMTEGRKYVLIDEAERLTPQTQDALKGFMEEFAGNCGFIFTINHVEKLTEELKGRGANIDFRIPNNEKGAIAKGMLEYYEKVLKAENVPYEKPVIIHLIKNYFGNWRRIINELQRFSKRGAIDSGILAGSSGEDWEPLITALKEKSFTNARKWVGLHSDIEPATLFQYLYETIPALIKDFTIPALIITLAEYQHKSALVVNQEINTSAMLAAIMSEVEWK